MFDHQRERGIDRLHGHRYVTLPRDARFIGEGPVVGPLLYESSNGAESPLRTDEPLTLGVGAKSPDHAL